MTDYSNYDIQQLVALWTAARGNTVIRSEIEAQIALKSANNIEFPRERLFEIGQLNNHAITIQFPGTPSHQAYGDTVTVSLVLEADEVNELMQNFHTEPRINTQGMLRSALAGRQNLLVEQITQLREVGFNTQDIYSIMHV